MAESRLKDEKMSAEELEELTSIVFNCIQEDNLCKLQVEMKKCQKSNRQVIVSQKINGQSPLFKACKQEKVHFINYLLDECNADIEQMGLAGKVQKTPLLYAASMNKLDVVKTLVQHGAQINSLSCGVTPVLRACFNGHVSVVKYLVEHGADIEKKDKCGFTCLMRSLGNEEIFSFLVNNGADVNAQSTHKLTPLHVAIRERKINAVQLLLLHKSDHTLKDDNGNDALQTAALRGYNNIVETILEMAKPPVSDAIRAYELLGTTFVMDVNGMSAALCIWKKAMALRYPNKGTPLLKQLPQRQSIYMHLKEPENMEELNNLTDPEEIYVISLMIRERILGSAHDNTFDLMCYGIHYDRYRSHRYWHCVDLWKYVCQLNNWTSGDFDNKSYFMIESLVKLVWKLPELGTAPVNSPVSLSDVLDLLNILVELIINLHTGVKMCAIYLNWVLELFLGNIHLISQCECSNTQKHMYMNIIHKIIFQDPRGSGGKSLLHLAVRYKSHSPIYTSPFPSLNVIKILVECGANIDTLRKNGNSPLYDWVGFVRRHHLGVQEQASILDYLVNKGAHVDICNYEGDSALTIIEKMALPFSTMKYVSLKCLASRVIMKHKIPYKEVVPKSLLSFVKLHGKRQA